MHDKNHQSQLVFGRGQARKQLEVEDASVVDVEILEVRNDLTLEGHCGGRYQKLLKVFLGHYFRQDLSSLDE